MQLLSLVLAVVTLVASTSLGARGARSQFRVQDIGQAPTPQLGPAVANTTSLVFSVEDSPSNPRGPITCYRIPMVVSTSNGTLVAFAEARIGHPVPGNSSAFKPSCDDCTVNGIAQRRSTDGGKTWGPVAWAVSDVSLRAIAEGDGGVVALLLSLLSMLLLVLLLLLLLLLLLTLARLCYTVATTALSTQPIPPNVRAWILEATHRPSSSRMQGARGSFSSLSAACETGGQRRSRATPRSQTGSKSRATEARLGPNPSRSRGSSGPMPGVSRVRPTALPSAPSMVRSRRLDVEADCSFAGECVGGGGGGGW